MSFEDENLNISYIFPLSFWELRSQAVERNIRARGIYIGMEPWGVKQKQQQFYYSNPHATYTELDLNKKTTFDNQIHRTTCGIITDINGR